MSFRIKGCVRLHKVKLLNKPVRVANCTYYMAIAASDSNMEILQFDWFMSSRILPVFYPGGRI